MPDGRSLIGTQQEHIYVRCTCRCELPMPETVADPPARSCYPLLSKSELWNFNELVLISFCRAAKPAPVPWHFGEAFRR